MKKYIPLTIILIAGVLLRFYHNLDISLWHDEAFSALMIRYPWGEMFYRLGLDVHPPMYYVALRLWHYIFGESMLSLRGFSIFFGTAAIWAGWLFTKEAFKSEKAALWAAAFIAINPFQLQYVTEARMYTFGAFFALMAAYFLVKALTQHKSVVELEKQNMPNTPELISAKRKMLWGYVGFTVSTIIIIYTHYYLFFTAAALGFYGLLYLYLHHQGGWKKFVPILTSYVLIVISFLPWLKTFLFQYRQVQDGYWISKMNVWSIPSTFWDMLLGFERDINKSNTQILLVLVTLFSLFMLYRFIRKTESFAKWLAVLAIAAPFGGAILFAVLAKLKGSDSSVYLDRYFLFGSLFYSVALAVWLKEIKVKWLSVSLFLVYCILNLTAYAHYWKQLDVAGKPGMAAAARFLATNVEPKHHVFVGTSYEFFNYKYYGTVLDPIPTRPLLFTGGRVHANQLSHVEGVALLTDADLVPDFKAAVNREDTVWLVWTYAFGSNKPETPANWVKIDEKGYQDVRPYPGTMIYITEYKVN
ncbi:MAG: glycosyltransferase family 39 protein [Candidatus Doudnabacteria bacterium]|nr:glycosyltransferase family 39 protein [Candidatus Doudnabacteria bacterium]